MRRALSVLPLVLAFALPAPASAQSLLEPPKLEPLPEPPSAPGAVTEGPGDAPVQIVPGPNDQVEEVLIEGRRVVRVTTSGGLVYYLKDNPIPGTQNSIDPTLHVPTWQLFTF